MIPRAPNGAVFFGRVKMDFRFVEKEQVFLYSLPVLDYKVYLLVVLFCAWGTDAS